MTWEQTYEYLGTIMNVKKETIKGLQLLTLKGE